MKYTDQSRIEAYLNRQLTADEGNIVEDVIEYISEYINTLTNRSWFSVRDEDGEGEGEDYAEEASTRLFDGGGSKELFIDDFTDVEKVEILDSQGNVFSSYEEDTDWYLTPNNTNPKTSIRLYGGRFPNGLGNIRITAKWGSGQAPKSVVMVATILCGKFFKKAEVNKSTFKSESIEGYSYTLQSNADHDEEIAKALDMLGMHKRIIL